MINIFYTLVGFSAFVWTIFISINMAVSFEPQFGNVENEMMVLSEIPKLII
jgi:hypothetical protein